MEKFIQFVDGLKTRGCLKFTGALCAYSLIDSLCGGERIRYILIDRKSVV